MNKARMPVMTGMAALLIFGGCDSGTMMSGWSPNTQKNSQHGNRLTSEPVTNQFASARSDAPRDKNDKEGDLAPLNEKVQKFVGQFPPDDRDRQAAARPAPANAVASSATPLPTPAVLNAPPAQNSTPPKAEPVSVVHTEAAASPAPREINTSLLKPAPAPRVELTEVRPAANASVGPTTRPAATPANQPVQDHAPQVSSMGIAAAIQELEQSVTLHPQQLDDQFKLRLLYVATDQDQKAAGPIDGADPVQADMIAAIFRMFITARQAIREPAAAANAALTAIDDLRRMMGQQSPIVMPKALLVTRVNSFGDYEAVNPARFPAGQAVHVFLYTEVANFRSASTEDNRLRTLLSEKVEVFDTAGKIVWQRSEPTIEDRTFSPRHDFFMTMELQLPAELPTGDYVLKVTIEDKLGATTDQQRLSFTIGQR